MGATSVTGVSGSGSVDGYQKGSWHMSLGVNHLVGPRVVSAGSVALVAGSAVVNLPDLVWNTFNTATPVFFALAQDVTTAANVVHVVLTYPMSATDATLPQLTLTGTGTDTVNYVVLKGTN